MKRNKIVFINQATGYLMLDIVNSFVDVSDQVVLLTGEINIRPTIPDKQVKIVKIKRYDKSSTFRRLFSWTVAFIQTLIYVKFRSRGAHLFLVTNPPLTPFIPLFCKNPFSILVYDIYPDSLAAQKYIAKKSWIYRFWAKKNVEIFNRADRIFTISNDMANVLSQYIPLEEIDIIYNWAHNEHMKPIPKMKNSFAKEYDLEEKFVVLYSGNMGMTHDLEILIEIAKRLRDDDSFRFVFIGEGAKKSVLQELVKKYSLSNVLFLPFQDLETLPFSMGAADLGVISLDDGSGALSIPSKTYSYLAVGAGLLCIADDNTELSRFVKENELGANFNSKALDSITQYIQQLAQTPALLHRIKENSRTISAQFSPENALKYRESLLK